MVSSQTIIDGVLWVTITDETVKPIEGGIITSNSSFNQILNLYNVTSYIPAFPNAKNQLLQDTYEIIFSGNTTTFYSVLQNSYGQFFSRIKLQYEYPNIEVYDPADYMWYLTMQSPNEWLWHLYKIQANDAWDITRGDEDVTIAILDTDIDIDHPDLQSELLLDYDPYDGYVYSCNPSHSHGTFVASFATAETTETGGNPNGQLASVGFDTKFIFYKAWAGNYLQRAHHASLVMGVDVLTSSAGGWRCQGDPDPIEEAVVKEILDNGTVIVMPAGNGETGTHCDCGNDGMHDPWYPLHPIYDERIIIVTGTDINDNHNIGTNGTEHSHSHFPSVDICSPGWGTLGAKPTDCGNVTWPYYGPCNGTSFATPIVAGVCALLKSVNKDLTPGEIQEILKTTTDPVTDASDYQGLIGSGRVNAFNAVNQVANCTPYTVSINETWNDDRTYLCDVVVESGVELVINSIIKFSQTSKLIVKSGGKLVLNNCLLTSIDNKKWAGIEVWGNINETQTEEFQGKLEMYNSTIEHAHEAVQLWKPGDYNKTGGMIYAENSNFTNNHRAVSFLSYKNLHPVFGIESDYSATFKRCTFKTDEYYLDDNPFYTYVTMWKVRGIKFRACEFNSGGRSGTAIATINAGYKVSSICNGAIGPNGCLPQDLERCEFIGFDKALSSENTLDSDLYPINIQHAYFYNNNYGCYFDGLQNVLQVKTSEFIIGNNGENKEKVLCGSFSGRGIHIQASTGFYIENNEFSKMPEANSSDNIIGIVAMNNPSDHDIIKKNTFSNLLVANEAYGNNRHLTQTPPVGIEYQCNENYENKIDFEVIDLAPANAKINPNIGFYNLSAHNKFTSTTYTDLQWHWRNMGIENESYYLYSTENGTNYEPNDNYIETSDPNNELLFKKKVSWEENQCPDDDGIHIERTVLTPNEQQELETEYAVAYSDYEAVETIYINLKDGGSTDGTTLSIASAQPDDTWELRDNLLGKSPHLSREVLQEAADRTDVLPNSVLLDILAANPDELKKRDFMEYLENKEEPLPDYMISILRDLSTGTTYKTVLLNQMALHKRKQVVSAKRIVNSLINQDEQDHTAIKGWLGNLNNRYADMQIAGLLIKEENYTDANALLELIPDLYNLQNEALNLYLDDKYMVTLEMNIKQDNRNITQLNSSEIAQLETIADNEIGAARSSARIILESFYGYNNYCDCLDRNENKSANANSKAFNEQESPLSIKANPNPATHYVEFAYELSEIDKEGIIIITDINGKQIQSFTVKNTKGAQAWDTRKIPAGSYIYTLKTQYFEKSGKLIIQ